MLTLFKFYQAEKKTLKRYEISEAVLFTCRIYEKLGQHKEALEFLKKHESEIVDMVKKQEYLGHFNLECGNKVEAIEHYEQLLRLNSANLDTYILLFKAKGFNLATKPLSEDDQNKLKAELLFLAEKLPRVNSHIRIGLRHLEGKHFAEFLPKYLRPLLIKGVPSVIQEIKEFYKNPSKVKLIEDQLLAYLASMDKEMTLSPGDEEEQDPTVYLWLNFFIAQHYKFKGDVTNALKYVDAAILHTPTLLELYTLKGKIYSMAGDRKACADLHEEARQLDMADRAINAISAMQKLKAGDFENGLSTMNIFVSDCGYSVTVHDNQTIWFELECGNTLYENGRYREALKQWNYIEKHTEHMVDDSADYLLYSFRRFTLTAFEELITMMDDTLLQNRFVVKTAYNYIRLNHKLDKEREQQKEKHEQALVVYKQSKEYETLEKELQKLEDEDEYQTDRDPDGYFNYENLLNGKVDLSNFVAAVCAKNANAPELQAKSIKLFTSKGKHSSHELTFSIGKFFAALRAGINLHEHHRQHPRYISGLANLFTYWVGLDQDSKKKVIPDERMLAVATQEIKNLGCPNTLEEIKKWAHLEASKNQQTINLAHELIKLDIQLFKEHDGFEKRATDSLLAHHDKLRSSDTYVPKLRVWDAVKLHKTLKKTANF